MTQVMTQVKELNEIEEKLKPLYKEQEKISRKISALCKKREKINNEITTQYIKTIPEDLSKISDKQWQWILFGGHRETVTQYKFQQKILNKMGLSRSGFMEQTNQTSLQIPTYNLSKSTIIKNFQYVKKHIKPVTITDKRLGTETGIRLEILCLEENENSIIYIHENEEVVLYRSRYKPKQTFQNFESFLNWYSEELSRMGEQY